MSPDKQAVIFDWNGTLLADTKLAVAATNAATRLLGAKPATVQRYQKEYSMPLRQMYVNLGCDEQELNRRLDEVFRVWGEHYGLGVHRLRLRRGARAVLQELKEQEHKTAILSNFTVKNIASQTQRLCVHHYLDEILANGCNELQNIMHKADKGERLKAFVDKHDIRQALVVGDSPEEIEIAHNYGYLGVGITGGFCARSRIRAAKPDFMINSLNELPAIVRRVFRSGRGK